MILLLIALLVITLPVTLTIAAWAPRLSRKKPSPAILRGVAVSQILVFGFACLAVLTFGVSTAHGAQPGDREADRGEAQQASGMTNGDGLAMVGVALATGLSVAGAGYAVGIVGAAALGAIAERPELFGRTLVFIGLAEGLAIYGLIVSVLILGRLG